MSMYPLLVILDTCNQLVMNIERIWWLTDKCRQK